MANPNINDALAAAGYVKPDKVIPVRLHHHSGLGTVATPGNPTADKYANQALERECATVAATHQGDRNDQLNRSAFKLGTLVGAGFLDGQATFDALTAAGIACGLPEWEARQATTSGLKAGLQHPREVTLTASDVQPVKPAETLDMDRPDDHGGTGQDTTGAPSGQPQEIPTTFADQYVPIDWHTLWEGATEDVPWLVYPLFERGRVYALYSGAKVGKSLIMHDVCAALASGRAALGNLPADPIDVMYIDFENSDADLVDRFQDFGYEPADLKLFHYFTFPALPALDSIAGGMHLVALVEKYQPVIVVVDTTSRVIQGKENDSDTFHALYRYAMMPLKAMGITVVRLDHSGKDDEKGMRGSSAKLSDVDAAWKLTRTGDSTLRLDLTAQRASHSPSYVLLDQFEGPLRHILKHEADGEIDTEVFDLVAAMDRLAMPTDWGRKRVAPLLREKGYTFKTTKLERALRIRKQSI